jgi:hypothetical protein
LTGATSSCSFRISPAHLDCHPLLDPDRFVPLDSQGNPIEGLYVQILPNGSLAPFEYRPSGRNPAGARQGLNIRLPSGAQVMSVNGQRHISFTLATASFGNDSPIRFPQPLTKSCGSASLLPIAVDSVNATNLATAFGLSATNGIPVVLQGHLPALWRGGSLTDTGIRGAKILPDLPGLPVPDGLIEYAEFEMKGRSARRFADPLGGLLRVARWELCSAEIRGFPAPAVVAEAAARRAYRPDRPARRQIR